MVRWLNLRSLIAVACLIGLTSACFGPALRPDRQLAYRDYSDFYYPLYEKVQQQWNNGRLPLWSDQENCGAPLLGNPTAAVLYPGKLIYAVMPYPVAAKIYVVSHVLLAFVAMVWLLRSWEVSAVGSTLAGLAYAFGGPVLTQYCNVVFLVGAAWMPLGFACADGWIRLGRTRAIAGLALVLALMVLGGDPEAAYLTAFFSVSYAGGRWVFANPKGRSLRVLIAGVALVVSYAILLSIELANRPAPLSAIRPENPSSWRLTMGLASLGIWSGIGVVVLVRSWLRRGRSSLEGRLLGLAGACGLALALSACQLLPTLEFIGQSTRGDASHFLDIYMQSINPARVVEWVWPNVFGSTFGVNRNWLTALPPTEDHNIWMNSIYLGGFTILLAGCALLVRNGPVGRGWMIGVALVSVLAGFGDFTSPILWTRAMSGDTARFGKLEPAEPELPRADGLLRDGDGGVYWFLSASLPGFRSFRYPGKLFIPAALAISALAGMGYDGLKAGCRRPGLILPSILLATGLIVLLISIVQPRLILRYLEGRSEPARSGFGPFDTKGAFQDLRVALVHGSIVLAAFLGVCWLAPRRPKSMAILTLLVVSIDLALANHGQVGTVSQSAYEQEPRTLAAIRQSEREDPEPGPFRIFRLHSWAPKAWNQAGSPDRLEEMLRWERDTLRSKYELSLGISSTFSYGSAELADLTPFFQPFPVSVEPNLANQLKIPADRPVNYYPRRGFDLWNTRYFILPTRLSWTVASRGFASLVPNTDPLYPPPFTGPDAKEQRDRWGFDQDGQVVRNRAAFPRAWVVHRVIPVGPTSGLTETGRRKLMTDLLYQADDLWQVSGVNPEDPRRVAWVEASVDKLMGLAGARDGSEPVKVIQNRDATRVELEVRLDSPGLVILADVNYPGWQLQLDDKPAEILRTNRAMRGAIVPAGTHRLVYTYRPASMIIGIVISGLALLAWSTLISWRGPIRDLTA